MVDESGYFYTFARMFEFLAQVNLAELEMEFRAQIDTVLSAGLTPTHLDWHALRLQGRDDICDVMFNLARQYGLALRVAGDAWIERVQSQRLPANDHGFLDSYGLDSANKTARYVQMLRELPVGLSEWAVHPGLDNAELRAIEPDGAHIRQADYNFLMSREAKTVVDEEGIILLDYRALQAIWSAVDF